MDGVPLPAELTDLAGYLAELPDQAGLSREEYARPRERRPPDVPAGTGGEGGRPPRR